jgi:hypothetical protein
VRRIGLAAAILAAACSKNIQTPEAVKAAIVEYLDAKSAQMGLNMANINVDVTALEFERDAARASVSFRVKGSDQATGMSMNYTLIRQGDKWVVRERSDASVNPHGAAVPQTIPEGSANGGALPPGHPSVGQQHGGASGSQK